MYREKNLRKKGLNVVVSSLMIYVFLPPYHHEIYMGLIRGGEWLRPPGADQEE
jgi:hypothetical protein